MNDDDDTRPPRFVSASGHGNAAGRDINVMVAEPCPLCEQRFVRSRHQPCRHCRAKIAGEQARTVLVFAFLGWLVAGVMLTEFGEWSGIALIVEHAYLIAAIITGVVGALLMHGWASGETVFGSDD